MKRFTLKRVIFGVVLLIVLVGVVSFAPTVKSAPIVLGWATPDGTRQSKEFDLGDLEERAAFLETFKKNPRIYECGKIADYAVELMEERDDGTSEGFHLEVMRVNYENTFDDPKGAVPWSVYLNFQRLVRDLHRNSGGRFFFTDSVAYWEREFRWCFIDAANWPDSW